MQYLNRHPLWEEISQVKDHSEHFDPTSLGLVEAELKQLFERDVMYTRNFTLDHPLVARYLALLSEQELR